MTQRLPMHLRWPSLGLKPYQELQICGICSKVELVLHRISTQCDKQPGLIPSLFSFIRISTSCQIRLSLTEKFWFHWETLSKFWILLPKHFFFFGELTQVLNPAEYGQVYPRPSKALREEKFRIFWDPLQTPKLVYFWNTITFSATGLGISIGWKTWVPMATLRAL